MAQEVASITIQLQDEFSSKMQEIAGKLEDFKRRMDETSARGREGFQGVGKEVARIGDHAAGVNTALQSMSSFMRSGFVEFNRTLGATVTGMGSFLSALRGAGGAVGGVAATVVVLGTAITKMGESLAEAGQASKNLRIQLGETTDAFIAHQRRIGEYLGESAEQTTARMQAFARQYHETIRGSASELFTTLTKFGDEGTRIFNQLERARAAGMGAVEAYQKILLPWVALQDEGVQRRLAALLHQPFEIWRQEVQAARDIRPPWMPSAEQQRELDEAHERLRKALINIRTTLTDVGVQAWTDYEAAAINKLASIYEWVDEKIPGAIRRLKRALDELREPTEPLLPRGEPRPEPAPGAPETWRIDPFTGQRIPGAEKQSQIENFRDIGGRVQLASLAGGGPILLGGERREATTYLREIRDVMVWIRDQQMGATTGGVIRAAYTPAAAGAPAFRSGGGYEVLGQQAQPMGALPGFGGAGPPAVPGPSAVQGPSSAPNARIPGTAPPTGSAGVPTGPGTPGGDVRATWFNTGPAIGAWDDPSGRREGPQASGLPHTTPGIATPGRRGLGEWHEVRTPDGRVVITRKTDIGPGAEPRSRGVGADINAALAAQLYPGGPKTFQEQGWGVRRIGRELPEGVQPGLQAAPMQSAGTTTGQGTADTPPSNILEMAKRVAATGGGPAVSRFMASMGYPKNGAWCGEFAASVVRAAGGTPPRNPEVATNWRNFGQQVEMPQPGDIAVRARSRFGGFARTGQVGSHVTIVGDVQDGTFTGIGGNQSRIESQYKTGAYQFFRAGQDRQFAAGQTKISGSADVNVNVRAPRGTRADATSSGVFNNPRVTLRHTGQMGSAGNLGTDEPNVYSEE